MNKFGAVPCNIPPLYILFAGFLTMAALGGALLWAYWPTLVNMTNRWSGDPEYSHGFLVPVFALMILWARRDLAPRGCWRVSWWGIPALALAGAMRFGAAALYFQWLDGLSLLPAVAGIVLLLGGWPAFRWSWPAIAFSAFMVPLPYGAEMLLAQPLRRLATVNSTFMLQTFGFPAVAEGNVILIDRLRLGVIDACSGLGMMFTFFALSTAVAIVIRRPLADRIIVLMSAVPIALAVNVVRITLTAIAHVWFGSDIGNALMHDFAGWIMMPLALGLMWLELKILSHLFIEKVAEGPMNLNLQPAGTPSSAER